MADQLPVVASPEWSRWLAGFPPRAEAGRDAARRFELAVIGQLQLMPPPASLDPAARSRIIAWFDRQLGDWPDGDDDGGGEVLWLALMATLGFIAEVALPGLTPALSAGEVFLALVGVRRWQLKDEARRQSRRLRRALVEKRYAVAQ